MLIARRDQVPSETEKKNDLLILRSPNPRLALISPSHLSPQSREGESGIKTRVDQRPQLHGYEGKELLSNANGPSDGMKRRWPTGQ